MNHAGVKSSIDSLMMFNEPTPRYPVVLLAPGVVPALPADGFLSLHLPDRFFCLPLSPFIWPRLSPSLDACHGSLGARIHLSPVVSQPGCVALTLRGFLHFPRFCPFGGSFLVLWMLGTGPSSVCPSSGRWVVFLVYRWLHPVCSFSASLSVAVPS